MRNEKNPRKRQDLRGQELKGVSSMRSVAKVQTGLKPKTVEVSQLVKDEDWGGFQPRYQLIPKGEHEVSFIRGVKWSLFGSFRLLTLWRVCEIGSQQHGVELPMGIQLPKYSRKFGQSSKMAKMFEIATGRKPDRYDRISPSVFKGKIFLAKVITVKKNFKQKPLQEGEFYSAIESLLSKVAGS